MEIRCPSSLAQTFDDIPNCFIGELDASALFPRSGVLAQTELPPIELIYEAANHSNHSTFDVDVDMLRSAIEAACAQYAANIAPEPIVDRFRDYLLEDLGLEFDEGCSLFHKEGIIPFLVLERIFISEIYSTISFDFQCSGDEYLWDYGFSFDIIGDHVQFCTPRLQMIDSRYPVSRSELKMQNKAEMATPSKPSDEF